MNCEAYRPSSMLFYKTEESIKCLHWFMYLHQFSADVSLQKPNKLCNIIAGRFLQEDPQSFLRGLGSEESCRQDPQEGPESKACCRHPRQWKHTVQKLSPSYTHTHTHTSVQSDVMLSMKWQYYYYYYI